MSRDTKILLGAAAVSVVIAAGKAKATTPDQFIEAAKSEAVPVLMNLGGLWLLFKFINK